MLRDGLPCLTSFLIQEYSLASKTVSRIAQWLTQQDATSEIPDFHTLLVEVVSLDGAVEYYVHTPLSRTGNDALARIFCHRLARDWGMSSTSLAADLGWMLSTRGQTLLQPDDFREFLSPEDFHSDLETVLEEGPMLRDRFGQVATTGLMVLRNPSGRRRKVGGVDWAKQRLFDQVIFQDPDFPLLRQAKREILADLCHPETAMAYVQTLPTKEIRMRWLAEPSPFARSWTQIGFAAVNVLEGTEAVAG
jgi:ATP-dependent Lhr-like helicase